MFRTLIWRCVIHRHTKGEVNAISTSPTDKPQNGMKEKHDDRDVLDGKDDGEWIANVASGERDE
jgi:hypothetical protein